MFCPFLENREEEKMINKLVAKIKETKAPIVVGLDPMLNYIPEHVQKKAFAESGETLEGAAEAIWQFNKEISVLLPQRMQWDIWEALKWEAKSTFHLMRTLQQ